MYTNSGVLNSAGRVATLCLAACLLVGISHTQILPSAQVKKLTATAKTSADHVKLAKHYEAVAAPARDRSQRTRSAGGAIYEESYRARVQAPDVGSNRRSLQTLC